MKKLLTIIFSLTISLCFSQTKEQLINSIIKVNTVESYCVGIACMVSPQYARFQKLKKKLSEKELIELSRHENPIIRTYASIELIQSNKGNVPELLSAELQKNEMVETFEGCIMGIDPVSSIIYHEYWNKIRLEESRKIKGNNYEQDLAMQKALATDLTMEKLDSVIIYSEKEVYWLLYDRTFKNRKHKDNYLPRITELAVSKNNAYAFDYLKKYYSSEYSEELENYLKNDFPKAKFQTENEVVNLHLFTKIMLESKNDDYKKIAIEKLRNYDNWKGKSGWFKATLRKYGIEL
ncbi:hypothetical protein [Nonlabens marinus]|uniref:Uncharacterized protein n=1 Tax=Nonlabens marinus S1-08 TaxID=1454201 RepID=W8VXJ8_9FLAO|nr:hypothetical protein [Nonlabens marinus]BAO56052.1 hypothetical protein NMS_2043 [Nonlabens marinus S1-08]